MKAFKTLLLCCSLLLPLASVADAGHSWRIMEVEPAYVGYSSSLALGPKGAPHMCFYDGHPGYDLLYAKLTFSGWLVEKVGPSGSYSSLSSLAIDGKGVPFIAFDDPAAGLACARRDPLLGWVLEAVDPSGAVAGKRSIAVGPDGVVHISYYASGDLRHAWRDGSGLWNTELVDAAGDAGHRSSLTIDSRGRPLIAYSEALSDAVKFAWNDGVRWRTETIAAAHAVSDYVCLAVDGRDRPHVVFAGLGRGVLGYALRTGGAWIVRIVDQVSDYLWDPSVAVGQDDKPHIAYVFFSDPIYRVRYARWTGTGWERETLPGWNSSGPSIAVGPFGWPQIGYYDGSQKFAVGVGKSK